MTQQGQTLEYYKTIVNYGRKKFNGVGTESVVGEAVGAALEHDGRRPEVIDDVFHHRLEHQLVRQVVHALEEPKRIDQLLCQGSLIDWEDSSTVDLHVLTS